MLNTKIPMDAENYYIQSGDMKDFNESSRQITHQKPYP